MILWCTGSDFLHILLLWPLGVAGERVATGGRPPATAEVPRAQIIVELFLLQIHFQYFVSHLEQLEEWDRIIFKEINALRTSLHLE